MLIVWRGCFLSVGKVCFMHNKWFWRRFISNTECFHWLIICQTFIEWMLTGWLSGSESENFWWSKDEQKCEYAYIGIELSFSSCWLAELSLLNVIESDVATLDDGEESIEIQLLIASVVARIWKKSIIFNQRYKETMTFYAYTESKGWDID